MYQSAKINGIEIIAVFIVPVLIIYAGIIPFKYRYAVMALVTLIIIFILWAEGWSWKDLGIRKDIIKPGLVPYGIFTLAGVSAIAITAAVSGKNFLVDNLWIFSSYYLISVVPSCVIQELGYRAILLPKLKTIFSSIILVTLIDACLFALLHISYPGLQYLLPATFIGGIGFTAMYLHYPNLFLISVSHIILNFALMLFSFFPAGLY